MREGQEVGCSRLHLQVRLVRTNGLFGAFQISGESAQDLNLKTAIEWIFCAFLIVGELWPALAVRAPVHAYCELMRIGHI